MPHDLSSYHWGLMALSQDLETKTSFQVLMEKEVEFVVCFWSLVRYLESFLTARGNH